MRNCWRKEDGKEKRLTLPKVTNDDLDALLDILPPHIRKPLKQQADISDLLEVVLDLGRSSDPIGTGSPGPQRSRVHGGEVHDPATQAALTELANLPEEPRRPDRGD